MDKKNTLLLLTLIVLNGLGLFSCTSSADRKSNADESWIEQGIKAWHEESPDRAAEAWEQIEDSKLRTQYLANIERFHIIERDLASAKTLAANREDQKLAALKRVIATIDTLDKRLTLPKETLQEGLTMSELRLEALVARGALAEARDLNTRTKGVFGSSKKIDSLMKEADIIEQSRNQTMETRSKAEAAAAIEDFDSRIAAYNEAIQAYVQGENQLNAASRELEAGEGARRLGREIRSERQNLEIKRDSEIREKVYTYKDRIGEAFAEVPQSRGEGIMGLEEILAHQERVKANINSVYSEMEQFASLYPQSIEREVLEEVNLQKRDLELKIIQVNNELRTAREIASRGKVVMPIMIGLFNPDPSQSGESKRSRPAVFSARRARKDEYWWGMVSIPLGVMNDLVITLKDNRTVRVFGENTDSGRLIRRNNLNDLVNRAYKIGNSWPVLNAGSQLPSNRYFFEVQEGKTPDYEGEVVVYSSFVVRMR